MSNARRVQRSLILAVGIGVLMPFLMAAELSSPSASPASSPSVPPGYILRWGSNPFLPSNARTSTGGLLDPAVFPRAEYCARCHQAIHKQWRESAHANSFREPFYLRNVELLIRGKGIEFTRHCEGCHNPIALFSGALTPNSKIERWFDEEGLTCSVCHSIQKVESTAGTGSYVIATPAVMVTPEGTRRTDIPDDSEILANTDLHRRAVMQDFYRTSEFCAVCHKAALPKEENGYKWLRAFSVYDEWQESSWSKQSPLPFYKKPSATGCQDCHMEATEGHEDVAAKAGKVASHRWIGANTAIPSFYAYPEQLRKTQEFLRDVVSIDIFALSKSRTGQDDLLLAPLNKRAARVFPGEVVTADLVIQNKRAGHSLVPEQRDFYEAWVEFTVKDSTGQALYQSGLLDASGNLDEYAHSYTNRLITATGEWVALHQVWDSRLRVYDNTILPGRSDLVRYRFRVPGDAKGPITLSARLRYRRFRRSYTDFVLKPATDYPIADLGAGSVEVSLGAPPAALSLENSEDLLRWNNYGIALLGQQQYWKAKEAFEHVQKLKPDYADGYINEAIAQYLTLVETRRDGGDGPGTLAISNAASEKFEPALESLARALKLDPQNKRALYYRGLIYRFQNRLVEAREDQAAVLKEYPRLRQARQELGYIYFLQSNYVGAREQFEALQSINPDHLTAHYYLALIYEKLGDKQKAADQAQLYAEKKEDPSVGSMAQAFWRGNPAISNELFPYHVHDDSLKGKYRTGIGAPLP